MTITARVGALALTLVLAGCSEPAIDASSEEAFYQSAGRMAQSLPADDLDAFTQALMVVAMDGIDFTADLAVGEQLDLEGAIRRLDGMTVGEVMAEAQKLKQRRVDGLGRSMDAQGEDSLFRPD